MTEEQSHFALMVALRARRLDKAGTRAKCRHCGHIWEPRCSWTVAVEDCPSCGRLQCLRPYKEDES